MGTVLIGRDTLTVMRPTPATDSHGWATGSTRELVGEWAGTLQWSAPNEYDTDHPGPYDPHVQRIGTAYLPVESAVREGDILVSSLVPVPEVVVRNVRLVLDPRASGDLDCIQAIVEEYITGGDD